MSLVLLIFGAIAGLPALAVLGMLLSSWLSTGRNGIAPLHLQAFPPPPSRADLAALARWEGAADGLGLSQEAGHFYRLRGSVEGVLLAVDGVGDFGKPGTLGISVRGTLLTPMPPGTRASHKDLPPEQPVRLEDPVLDGLIALTTREAAATRERLCTDAVRGPLLDVLHAHPGSVLRARTVELVVPEDAGDPAPLIRKVVDLVRALG